MKILILVGILGFIVFSIWYAKRNGATGLYQTESKVILTEKDNPIDFGYKMVWIAAKTDNKKRIAEIL